MFIVKKTDGTIYRCAIIQDCAANDNYLDANLPSSDGSASQKRRN